MSYNCHDQFCPRIQHFSTSNPNIRYDQSPIGDEFHDNVKQINAAAVEVSRFRNSTGHSVILVEPTGSPTFQPSSKSSLLPTIMPTKSPSIEPTVSSSWQPSLKVSLMPTTIPTHDSLNAPSSEPTFDRRNEDTESALEEPTKNLTCKKNEIIFRVEIDTGIDDAVVIWHLNNTYSGWETNLESASNAQMCVRSGSCFVFTIRNIDSIIPLNNLVQYRIFADNVLKASGSAFDMIVTHNIAIDYNKRFYNKIRKNSPPRRRSCAWLGKRDDKRIHQLCKNNWKFRYKCPETCDTCKR